MWACLSGKLNPERETSGACMYMGNKLQLRLERSLKLLDYPTIKLKRSENWFSSFFCPKPVFLTKSLPESNGDTLSLAMLAMSGELILTDSRKSVPSKTMAIIFLAAVSPDLKSIINPFNHSLLSTYFVEFSDGISNSMKYTWSLLLLFLLHAGDQFSSLTDLCLNSLWLRPRSLKYSP